MPLAAAHHDTSPRRQGVLMVMDVVESVKLMEQDESGFVRRWRQLVEYVEQQILPAHGGRIVKSLGDGLMLEFGTASGCVRAAFSIQDWAATTNTAPLLLQLRFGAHRAEFVSDRHDIYGTGVNLTARIATLAGLGELVVTSEVRDDLTAGLDADIEDLGDCYLKHMAEPVRAWRIAPVASRRALATVAATATLAQAEIARPALIVIPFAGRHLEPGHEVLGEILAEEIIAGLSRSTGIDVISRLSTTALRDREEDLPRLAAMLGERSKVSYALTGAYRSHGDRIVLTVELAQLDTNRVVWADSLKGPVASILAGEDEITAEIVLQASQAVVQAEMERATSRPLPTLHSASLQLGAVTLMHRASRSNFERVGQMFEHLIDRHPRAAAPRAWMAKWHVLRVTRGMAPGDAGLARQALDLTRRALDSDPSCSLALAVEGFVQCHLVKDLDAAAQRYELALDINPNESLAWLFSGVVHSFRAKGAAALAASERALQLSPLDPLLYFYQSLAATAALAAGDYGRVVQLAQASLRANRFHPSTYRALVIGLALSERMEEAREAASQLLQIEPEFTVSGFLRRSPSSGYPMGNLFAEALRASGLPH